MIFLFNVVTAGFYVLSSLTYLFHVIFGQRRMERIAVLLFTISFVLHSALLGLHLAHNHYPFILGQGDFYFSVSWIVAVIFLFHLRREPFSGSGAFFAPLTLFFFVISLSFRESYHFHVAALANPWALVHILFMSLSFAVFLISFLIGLIFLLQEYQLKNRHTGRFLNRLPPLGTMDGIHYKALTVGFSLLSVGILAGAALSKATEGRFLTGDPRQLAALGTWALYALFLNVRLKAGWRGRKGILLSLLGFVGVVLTFLGLEHRL